MQNERVLATSEGAAEAEVVIDSRLLGLGPVRIQGVEYVAGGETARVTAEPIEFEVVPPPALPALEVEPDANWAKGIEVTPDGGQLPGGSRNPVWSLITTSRAPSTS